jgi:hypothetical protein
LLIATSKRLTNGLTLRKRQGGESDLDKSRLQMILSGAAQPSRNQIGRNAPDLSAACLFPLAILVVFVLAACSSIL